MTKKPSSNSSIGSSPQPKPTNASGTSGTPGLDPGLPTASHGATPPAQSDHDRSADISVADQTSALQKGDTMSDDGRNEKGWFKPGYSGNPNGRPPKAKPIPAHPQSCRELVHQELTELISAITADGERMEMQVFQAAFRRQRNLALGGCPKAFKVLLDAIKLFDLREVLFRPPEPSPADLAFLAEFKKRAEEWARPAPGDSDYDGRTGRSDSTTVTGDLDDDPSIEIVDPTTGKPHKTY